MIKFQILIVVGRAMVDFTYGGMNNPHRDLMEEVKLILELGLDYVEITVEWPNSWVDNILDNVSELFELANSYNSFYLVHSPWYLEIGHPYDDVRRGALREAFKVIDIAAKLESAYVTFHPFTPGWLAALREKAREFNVAGFRELVAYSKEKGVQILVENVDHGAFRSPSDIRYLVDSVPGLLVTLDIGHTFLNGGVDKLRSYINKLGSEIMHLHAHDNDLNRDLHLPIGAGRIPWNEVVEEIRSWGYKGTVTLEPHVSDMDYLKISRDKLSFLLEAPSH